MKRFLFLFAILFLKPEIIFSSISTKKVIYVHNVDFSSVNNLTTSKKEELSINTTRELRAKLESMGFITASMDDFKDDSAIRYNEAVSSIEETIKDFKLRKADYELISTFYSTNSNIAVKVNLRSISKKEFVEKPQINKDATNIDQAIRAFTSIIDMMFYGEYYEKTEAQKKVIFKTQPKGAKVIISGKLLDTNKIHEIPVGPHSAVFELDNYASIVETIDIMPDAKEPIEINRKFDTPKAYLVWNKIPKNAEVFLNKTKVEIPVGRTIVDANVELKILIKKENYKDWEKTITLKPWETRSININELDPIKATLSIYSLENSLVFIDDKHKGEIINKDKAFELKNLEVGKDIKLTIRKKKHRTYNEKIKFMPGEKLTKRIDLEYIKYDEGYLEKLDIARTRRTWGYVTLSTSIALYGGGIYYFIRGLQSKSKYNKSTDPIEIINFKKATSKNNNLTYMFAGLGTASAITSIVLFRMGKNPPPPEEKTHSYNIAPNSNGFTFNYKFNF